MREIILTMSRLSHVRLSNVRRFGCDVDISLSPQATIILAPNGTGKTALFEAIELALTGKVARLNDDLHALIRDGEDNASVTLEFDTFSQQVVVNTEKKVFWTPPFHLFGQAKPEDVSYLFRLTHLLDQRDQHWFIQGNSHEAGEQLAKLPIGKDALHVKRVLPKIRRSLNKLVSESESKLKDAEIRVNRWKARLEEREDVRQQSAEDLPSLEQVVEKIASLSSEDFKLDSIEAAATAHSACDSKVKQLAQEFEMKYAKLQRWESRLIDYEECRENELVHSSEVVKAEKAKAFALDELEQVRLSFERATTKLRESEANLEAQEQLNLKFQRKEQVLTELNQTKSRLKETKTALALAEKKYTRAQELYDEHRNVLNKFSQQNAKKGDLHNSYEELAVAENALSKWGDYLTQIELEEEKVEKARVTIEVVNDELASVSSELDLAEKRAESASESLSQLEQASDQVRASVATISANISSSQADCPVCGVEHGSEELKRRVKEQLKVVNPALRSLTDHYAECKKLVSTLRQSKNSLSEKLSSVSQKRVDALRKIREFKLFAENVRKVSLLSELDFKQAKLNLAKRRAELEELERRLEDYFASLPEIPTQELLSELDQQVKKLWTTAKDKSQLIFDLEAKIKRLSRTFDVLNVATEKVQSKEKFVENLESLTKMVEELRVQHGEAVAALTAAESVHRQCTNKYDTAYSEWVVWRNKLMEYNDSWSSEKLSGPPSKDVLDQTLRNLVEELSSLESEKVVLDEIRKQIALLRGAEKYQTLQSQIDLLRGNQSEEAYTEFLINELELLEGTYSDLTDKAKAFSTLEKNLVKEVEEIQARVSSVEPLWHSLLGRVVREERFSETSLKFYNRYRKSHLNIKVPISGNPVSAVKVASEAQKADLQLTFLLSMALSHQWSPWKALLLDDPTQHHDLVHASSVFDLLRDYVVHHGFQVIVTTHDPVQARFFARKLRNDGVDTRLITLGTAEGGVRCVHSETGY